MNLLLTCSTYPDFSQEALRLWNNFCIAEWMPGREIVPYLKFAPASSLASIDAIVFLEPDIGIGFIQGPDGALSPFPAIMPWEAHYGNAAISEAIRALPESCAMRDGRNWKKIQQIVLTRRGRRDLAYDGLDVEFVIDITEAMLFSGAGSPVTWNSIERIISQYHALAAAEYERVGLLVSFDHGLFRVRKAFHKKYPNESDFYYGN